MKSGMKILAVDDDDDEVLKSIRRVISSRHPDITVDLTSDPDQCLEMIRDTIYELIITDFLMPGMDGLELVEKIKEIKPEQKVIIITGYATLKSYTEAIHKGASNLIPKPYTRDELLNVIELIS